MNATATIERRGLLMWSVTITRRSEPDAIATETKFYAWTHKRAFLLGCRELGLPA